MSDRSGVGLVDLTVLEVIEAFAAGRPRAFIKSARVIAGIEDRIGLGPQYGYDVLVGLARPWTIPIRLVAYSGNFGDRTFPEPANPGYTECRVSNAGRLVLAAEAHQQAPVPAGLINGTSYRGGTQPPLEPFRVLAALRRLTENPRLSDTEILGIVGPPDFVSGCSVTGDLAALARGRPVRLRLTGAITATGVAVPAADLAAPARPPQGPIRSVAGIRPARPHHLTIESLPPDADATEVLQTIASRTRSRPWADSFPELHQDSALAIRDVSYETRGNDVRLAVTLHPGADADAVREQLAGVWGVYTEVRAAFPAPLADLLRSWVDRYRDEDIATSLAGLETAIRRDRRSERRRR